MVSEDIQAGEKGGQAEAKRGQAGDKGGTALVIGGGPAGLMAAEVLAGAGLSVLVADRMPSLARKLLMAGKSGLNLTKAEPLTPMLRAYGESGDWLRPMLRAFGADQVQAWARGLGQELFIGSTGRVFPRVMKASPLLRAWLRRLDEAGVEVATRWTWRGWDGAQVLFDTPEGPLRLAPTVTVLALGGGSWARLGSDGAWAEHLEGVAPFAPSNCGFRRSWSDHMAGHFGQPVKAVTLRAGGHESRGEFVISRGGIEGGGIYALSAALREGAALVVDLFPDTAAGALAEKIDRLRKGESAGNRLRKLGLDAVKRALVMEVLRPLPGGGAELAHALKALPLALDGPQEMDRAISTAGGLTRAAVDEGLMLRARPGTFAAGEMLDWDAPTGGYLLTACLATGLWAGRAAADYALADAPASIAFSEATARR
ncbi:TIGR03862 family flavoprotein [Oceanicola sp. S124]|uniref:TIGR03862 family flavoprotein n=1 Tax=Oceanicola sp. S124 TaxID=1042378 RepID=UPI00025596CD|nr:TIGR03862 family flavoprotein [Oceanicola sp. S124]